MKKIAYGESFENFYNDGFIYVDKTKEIYTIINYGRVFFSRPRRFGKSTVLDTIATLFEKGIEPYFKDTWIYDKWTEKTYPILRLNFLEFSVTSFEEFVNSFNSKLSSFARKNKLDDFVVQNTIYDSLVSLFDALEEQRIVILIDEYDCQLTANINNPELYNKFQQSIRSLYAVIKGKKVIKFLGITGITRLKDISIFSVGSDINDVTYEHSIASITGFTREEIEKYYIDYVNLTASIQNNISIEQVTNAEREEVLDRLAVEYNGYCFDQLNQIKVFSTWSVNKFFDWVKNNEAVLYGDYWYGNGGIPSILSNYLEAHDLDYKKFEQESIEIDYDNFSNQTSLLTMEQDVLMCQTGYLTINSPLQIGTYINVKVPNNEVKKALYRLLSFNTFGVKAQMNYQHKVLLEKGTADDVFNILNILVNSLSYEKYPITNESALRGFLYAFFIGAGLTVLAEHQNSKGRSDLEIDYDNRRMVLELKYAKDSSMVQSKLVEAVEQIKERDYGNTFPLKKEVLRIALVFNGENKQFEGFQVV